MGIQQVLFGSSEIAGIQSSMAPVQIADYEYPPTSANAGITLLTNGQITKSGNTLINEGSSNWYLPISIPPDPPVGTGYWVRATKTFGNLSDFSGSDKKDIWYALSSTRVFEVVRSVPGAVAIGFTLEFATDSGGSTVVATIPGWYLEAEQVF